MLNCTMFFVAMYIHITNIILLTVRLDDVKRGHFGLLFDSIFSLNILYLMLLVYLQFRLSKIV